MISAAFDSKLNSRLFRNPSTLYRPQPSLAFLPVPRPLFRFCRFTVRLRRIRISHPSGSRRLCFKRKASKHSPWSSWTPENHRCHAVFNWMGYKSCGYQPTPYGLTTQANQDLKQSLAGYLWLQQVPTLLLVYCGTLIFIASLHHAPTFWLLKQVFLLFALPLSLVTK